MRLLARTTTISKLINQLVHIKLEYKKNIIA